MDHLAMLRPIGRNFLQCLRTSWTRTSQIRRPVLQSTASPKAISSPFSSTARAQKKGGKQPARDRRILNVRYHLFHPRIPRPLRFSRLRALRHWTIHRAWMTYQYKKGYLRERELERQYNSMARACEELRLMGMNGLKVTEDEFASRMSSGDKTVGRLYRIAMEKKRVWGEKNGFPIEYARAQTDYPSTAGWNHEWTR